MYNVFGSLGDNAVYSAELNEIIFVTDSVPVNVSPTFVITLPLAEPDKKADTKPVEVKAAEKPAAKSADKPAEKK